MTGALHWQGLIIERFVILTSVATDARAGDGPPPAQGSKRR